MTEHKSPFMVFQNFISQAEVKAIATATRVVPTQDEDGNLDAMVRHHAPSEDFLFPKFKALIPEIEKHFAVTYKGTEPMVFQQFPSTNGKNAEEALCFNATYKRKKWIRINERALTGILWLKDYQDQPPFDVETQVYGGKLEFPVYNFGFQPQAGTLVVYPACERFISLINSIQVGELQVVRIHMHIQEQLWLYNPANFPGDYRTWFQMIV